MAALGWECLELTKNPRAENPRASQVRGSELPKTNSSRSAPRNTTVPIATEVIFCSECILFQLGLSARNASCDIRVGCLTPTISNSQYSIPSTYGRDPVLCTSMPISPPGSCSRAATSDFETFKVCSFVEASTLGTYLEAAVAGPWSLKC